MDHENVIDDLVPACYFNVHLTITIIINKQTNVFLPLL